MRQVEGNSLGLLTVRDQQRLIISLRVVPTVSLKRGVRGRVYSDRKVESNSEVGSKSVY